MWFPVVGRAELGRRGFSDIRGRFVVDRAKFGLPGRVARGDLVAARGEGVVEEGDGNEHEGGEGDEACQPSRRQY